MLRNDQQWLALTDAFHNAAVDGKTWYRALESLAHATGSRSGQLLSAATGAAAPVNLITDADPAGVKAYADMQRDNPTINPRVKARQEARLLEAIAESDFITEDECRRNPHYQEFARPWDIPYICQVNLERSPQLQVSLHVLRSQRQGHITGAQREIFAAAAPHVRAAVRTQIALEGNGASVLSGALGALSIAAFVCDRTGSVRALTPSAERLVSSGKALELKDGRLRAHPGADDKSLSDAIDAAALAYAMPSVPMLRTVIVHPGKPDEAPLVIDVIALRYRQYEFSFAPRLLVVVRGASDNEERRVAILQTAYALTSAETDIAVQLTQGKTPEVIAKRRQVSIGTVRAQIKSILSKVGAKRQIELVARLNQF